MEVKEPTDVAAESEEESEESEESEEESDSEENDDDSDSEEESDDEESKSETVWERIQVGFLNLNYQTKIERITNIYDNLASDIKIFWWYVIFLFSEKACESRSQPQHGQLAISCYLCTRACGHRENKDFR